VLLCVFLRHVDKVSIIGLLYDDAMQVHAEMPAMRWLFPLGKLEAVSHLYRSARKWR
jgi:hypothetical protein